MQLNSKGPIMIPAEIRERCGWSPGDELDMTIDESGAVRIVRLLAPLLGA